MPDENNGDDEYKNYQVFVSEMAWRAFPKWGRARFLDQLPLDFNMIQPTARLRTRRCCRLKKITAAKLEAINIRCGIVNPWSPNNHGTRYGSGRLGLAIEAIGQMVARTGIQL